MCIRDRAHGGPLRLVVPGYQGVNNIKYVKRVAFTSAQSQARIMSHGYRMSPPGSKASNASSSAFTGTERSTSTDSGSTPSGSFSPPVPVR